ncbi:tRNA uridine-5-carboxymethylaminomethyl(34) synthesis GTPase MnmE [Ciceribacter sp. RN22]|uniref:tRNA uridine-5-carboxymethylaminomethyl(34) synthesis GTPase MnmE n=1 Tax=Ciceribacter sp. RN22 TaxID=2954932 RepID=UPI0020935FA5|nr:tRNA uridine-5-carboxymethylaminomethyl(34) synthesis GTPase MnmE [Ciceribacter sp. RN22]MCO6180655.1 tRNA uridine-5-carboxymethylaminomethyl(34) synthesis GTPase MnmE [Ciceribacter sp. RN22]
MIPESNDTIFALSSGGLPAGVAVVRLSGPGAFSIVRTLSGELPSPRYASLRSIRSRNGNVLDSGLVIVFHGPASFTGEDCAEIHLHGGKAVVAALLSELETFDRCRLAEAGEFSRRAFENGKLDLVEIEGLADLLAAETEMQRRLAVEQSFGRLSAIYGMWRERLLHARAMVEAELDFADESDIPGSISDRIWPELESLADEVRVQLQAERAGEIIRDGFRVVIAGAPNAGKSSLLNALANREVAIVTEYAGTTRDILHCELNIEGFAVHLFDTAGIRETDEPIEQEGIRRAIGKMAEADLILYLRDASTTSTASDLQCPGDVPVINVGTKSDLLTDSLPKQTFDLMVSSVQNIGLDEVRQAILRHVQQRTDVISLAIPSRIRQRQHLRDVLANIDDAVRNTDIGLELRAEHLRRASDALGRISGKIDIESMLGKIFSDFCVGK